MIQPSLAPPPNGYGYLGVRVIHALHTHTPYQFFGPVWGMKISLTTILYNHIMPNQGISMGELLDF